MEKKDHPGVYIPPPLIYVLTFLTAVFMQRTIPIASNVFRWPAIKFTGIALVLAALLFLVPSLRQFLKSRNTLITVKAAFSLQTDGIYTFTRNPMYAGLAILYLAITCFAGNWWNLILFPVLLLVVQEYIIKREEKYLERRFGQSYLAYKSRTGRWL